MTVVSHEKSPGTHVASGQPALSGGGEGPSGPMPLAASSPARSSVWSAYQSSTVWGSVSRAPSVVGGEGASWWHRAPSSKSGRCG